MEQYWQELLANVNSIDLFSLICGFFLCVLCLAIKWLNLIPLKAAAALVWVVRTISKSFG